MKLDNVLLLAVGVVIVLILLGLGMGVIMVLSGDENGGTPNPNTIIKYQCYDGSLVSKLSDCPKTSSTLSTSVSTVATVATSRSSGTCPKCDCVTRPTTSPPTTLCIKCANSATCGQEHSDLTCKSGDILEIVYTPSCTEGCCLWKTSSSVKTICSSDETCKDGICTPRPPEEPEDEE